MKRWGYSVVLAAGLAVAGCGQSAEDEATSRACRLLASAEDSVADAINAYAAMGKPPGGTQAGRDAIAAYAGTVAKAADEALGAPADISAAFQDAAHNARLWVEALNAGDAKNGGVFALAIDGTVDKCRRAGVAMPISDIVTE